MHFNTIYSALVVAGICASPIVAHPSLWSRSTTVKVHKNCGAKQTRHIADILSDAGKIINAAVTIAPTDPSWKTFFDPKSADRNLHSRVLARFGTIKKILEGDDDSITLSCADEDDENCYATEAYTRPPYDFVYLCPAFFQEPNVRLNDEFVACGRIDATSEVPFMTKSAYLIHEIVHTLPGDAHIDDCVYGPFWAAAAAQEGGRTQAVEFNADNYVSAAVAKYFNVKCKNDVAIGSEIDAGDKMSPGLMPMLSQPKKLGVRMSCLWDHPSVEKAIKEQEERDQQGKEWRHLDEEDDLSEDDSD